MPILAKNAVVVLEKRYLRKDEAGKVIETPADMFWRVAEAIAKADLKFNPGADITALAERFYQAMAGLVFLPNSPTLMNAGRELGQLSACFVLPVGDSMDEIFDAVKHTALIHKSGGGTGFSFSRLRPKNDMVQSTKGISSGPISFMRVFDIATETIKQGGTRRGANMGLLRVDHPDILDFIRSKSDQKQLNNFNISVGLTDAFMQALERDESYALINPRSNSVCGTLKAREVFDLIVKQAWESGEPGIIYLDRMNRDNPTPNIGDFESTNPCGEQPLLPYESCNLGSINLGLMVKERKVDWQRLKETVHLAIHFLDNVIELNRYPLPLIAQMTYTNRKIGLGVMGWADMLITLGISYNSEEAIELGEKVMGFINDEGHEASEQLAATRGPFPNYKGSVFNEQGKPPIRNATVTTVAPTGTTSIIANASSGTEPLYAISYKRKALDNQTMVEVNPLFELIARERGFYSEALMKRIAGQGSIQGINEIPEDVQRIFVTAYDIAPEDHIRMQAAFQKGTDNAVSKTVNFPRTATVEDVRKVYELAYRLDCKGVTIYRDGSRENQVLSTAKLTSQKPAREEKKDLRDRPISLKGWTYRMQTGCGPLYVTINEDEDGLFELFTTMGKSGGCAATQNEAIGRLVSLSWRSGVGPKRVIKQLLDISCHSPSGFGENKVLSCADAVARAIMMHISTQDNTVNEPLYREPKIKGACPECGGRLDYGEGCPKCHSCGYNQCG